MLEHYTILCYSCLDDVCYHYTHAWMKCKILYSFLDCARWSSFDTQRYTGPSVVNKRVMDPECKHDKGEGEGWSVASPIRHQRVSCAIIHNTLSVPGGIIILYIHIHPTTITTRKSHSLQGPLDIKYQQWSTMTDCCCIEVVQHVVKLQLDGAMCRPCIFTWLRPTNVWSLSISVGITWDSAAPTAQIVCTILTRRWHHWSVWMSNIYTERVDEIQLCPTGKCFAPEDNMVFIIQGSFYYQGETYYLTLQPNYVSRKVMSNCAMQWCHCLVCHFTSSVRDAQHGPSPSSSWDLNYIIEGTCWITCGYEGWNLHAFIEW